MRHSLHSHILYLENKVQALRDHLTRHPLTSDEIQGLELQISLAELALARYREAYALEISVSGPEPPDPQGGESDGENGHRDGSKPRKNDGLAARPVRRRKRIPAEWQPGPSAPRRHAPVAAR